MIGTKYVIFDIETTGLSEWYGDRVTCICAVDSDGNWFAEYADNFLPGEGLQDKVELELIQKFVVWLGTHSVEDTLLVGHNSKSFDAGFILARPFCIRGAMEPFKDKDGVGPGALLLKQYEAFDTFEVAKTLFGGKWFSLDKLAAQLGLSCSKCGSGLQAIRWWHNKEYDKLVTYCRQDVRTTLEVFLKLRERL